VLYQKRNDVVVFSPAPNGEMERRAGISIKLTMPYSENLVDIH